MEGENIMFFRFVLLIISFSIVLFLFEYLIPKLKSHRKLYKEIRAKRQRQKAFRDKMKELEIK